MERAESEGCREGGRGQNMTTGGKRHSDWRHSTITLHNTPLGKIAKLMGSRTAGMPN